MKILLLTTLLLSSCSLFKSEPIKKQSLAEKRYRCVLEFYKLGMNPKDAKESCGFVLKRR